MEPRDKRDFKPARSNGGLYTLILTIFIVGLISIIIIPLILITTGVIITVFGIMFIAGMSSVFSTVLFGYYTMKYEIDENNLLLRWAFFKDRIPLDSIARMGTPSTTSLDGIRTGGVGIPYHLFGRFRLLFEGKYRPVKLYATKLAKLVLIITKNGKYFGITPENPTEFMMSLSHRTSDINPETIDNKPPLQQESSVKNRNSLLVLLIFLVVFIGVGINLVYLLAVYPELPDIVPLHYDLTGTPNRFGSKEELLLLSGILFIIPIGFNLLIFAAIKYKSELQKSKLGVIMMLLPLGISITFLILNFVLINAIL